MTISLVYFVLQAAVAFSAGYFMRKSLVEAKIGSAEERQAAFFKTPKVGAEAKYREKMLEVEEEAHKLWAEIVMSSGETC